MSVTPPCPQCDRVLRAAADRTAAVTLALRKAAARLHDALGHQASTVRGCDDPGCVQRLLLLDGTVGEAR